MHMNKQEGRYYKRNTIAWFHSHHKVHCTAEEAGLCTAQLLSNVEVHHESEEEIIMSQTTLFLFLLHDYTLTTLPGEFY